MKPTITGEAQRAERAQSADDLLATVRVEGWEQPPEFLALTERYIAGEVTLDQFSEAVDGLLAPDY